MKYAFYLSGENIPLAVEEVRSFVNGIKVKNRVIIADCDKFDFKRLAYTKKVIKLILECNQKEFLTKLSKTDFDVKNTYCVRAIGFNEKKAAGIIWDTIVNPKVKLVDPETTIQIICDNDNCYAGILEHDNLEEFSKRRPHLRQGFHPSSLLPKLARALVNLSGIKENQTLLDPFCGTGGILIESCLMGINSIGQDIDEEMLALAERNLKQLKVKNYTLKQGDATLELPSCDSIAADLPYGKSTSLHGEKRIDLYNQFLKNAYKTLKPGCYCVIMIPHNVKINLGKFKKETEILHYVNKSLTRKILVLKKD